MFTERIFDTYSAVTTEDDDHPEELDFHEFLVCVWNFATYDSKLMAQYVFNIFDIDRIKLLTLHECFAMLRMVHYNQTDSYNGAAQALRESCEGPTLTLDSFISLVETEKQIIQPIFDIRSRIIERTTGDKKSAEGTSLWSLYREKRIAKFGSAELPDIESNGKSISSSARFKNVNESCELSREFLSTLFTRVERHLNAPDGFDSRLEEERYVDKLRYALSEVEEVLFSTDFTVDRVEERKGCRIRLWNLITSIKEAHVEALHAELERDLGIWERNELPQEYDDAVSQSNKPTEYLSEDEIQDLFEDLHTSFNSNWPAFVDSYEDRFGPATTCWEKLYDADQKLSFYFQWQTAERCYDQQLGNCPPAICEVCDHIIELTDYKCFNCDAPRSKRNRKKYRGRISLENMEVDV